MQTDVEQDISLSNSSSSALDIESAEPPVTTSESPPSETTPRCRSHSNHLTAQHGNIGCQLFTASVTGATGSPIAQIPGRLIQATISVRTFFQPAEKVSRLDKAAHGIQVLLAIALLAIAIVRFQKDELCTVRTNLLCKNELLLDTLYTTMLLLSWGPAQIANHSKKPITILPPFSTANPG